MKVIAALVLFAVVVSAVSPDHTIMQPGKGGDSAKGETVLHPQQQPASTKPMTQAIVEKPKSITQACDCCHQEVCGCCQKKEPEFVAPEIKEEPKKCPCAPAEGQQCSNTCDCCKTHVQPEIKAEPQNNCNCCHLDSCGCCKKEYVAPEQKEAHTAPEVVEKPKCPCAETHTEATPCACKQ